MIIPINLVFEDELSEFTMTKIISFFGAKFYIGNSYNGSGFGYIKKNINGFNEASVATPFFILTDLDSAECPSKLITEWLTKPRRPNLIFRIAVREIEAWLLADLEGLSDFFGIAQSHFPKNPELIADPKMLLIQLAGRSRKRDVREDIVPINSNAKIGPNYNGRLMEFILDGWDINRAKRRSNSLARTLNCLEQFQYKLPTTAKK